MANNLAFLGFGEDKLPDSLKEKLIALAAPYAPLDGINEKGLAAAVLRIADEPTNQDTETETWNSFSLKVLYKNKKIYRKNLHEDLYLRGFLADLYLMPSCYQCRFKGEQRIADITIGDLWGAEALVDQDFDCRKGVSFVWTHTKKGCSALE